MPPIEEGGVESDRAGNPISVDSYTYLGIPDAFAPDADPGPGRITLHSRGSSVAVVESLIANDINYRLITPPTLKEVYNSTQ